MSWSWALASWKPPLTAHLTWAQRTPEASGCCFRVHFPPLFYSRAHHRAKNMHHMHFQVFLKMFLKPLLTSMQIYMARKENKSANYLGATSKHLWTHSEQGKAACHRLTWAPAGLYLPTLPPGSCTILGKEDRRPEEEATSAGTWQ